MGHSSVNKINQEIKISLLLNDMSVAKEISEVFRQMDIIPAIYDNLQDLWFDILKERPTLCIVDVKNLSDGDLILKHHPAVKAKQLNLSFYYNKNSAPLLISLGDVEHWGLISDNISADIQIKGILDRINRYVSVYQTNKNQSLDLSKKDEIINRLYEEHHNLSEKIHYRDLTSNLVDKLSAYENNESFYDFISQSLLSFDEIEKFSLLEISESGQRLVCPMIANVKFQEIPSVWLGKVFKEGVDFYGENMATQVFIDLIGVSQITIPVNGAHSGSDAFISIKIKESAQNLVENIDWMKVGKKISSVYKSYKLKEKSNYLEKSNELNMWSLFDLVSNYYFTHYEIDSTDSLKTKSLISLDFANLIDNATLKTHTKFYWKKFYFDFMNYFSKKINVEFNYSTFSLKIYFICNKIDEDHFWTILESYSLRFSYWKYFDEVDAILAKNMKPEIKSLIISPTVLKNEIKVNTEKPMDFSISTSIKSKIRANRPEITM